MQIENIPDIDIDSNATVRVKEMGNIIEVMYSNSYAAKCTIKKISKDKYIDLKTGELKKFKKTEHRGQNLDSVRKSLGRLRDYINTNIIEPNNSKWVTLTYKENMTNTKQLYDDFKKFNMRLQYQLNKKYGSKGKYEYIVSMEPQARGAWHCHLIMIWDCSAPYIPNDRIADIWGFGHSWTTKIDDVDNVGAYLTAYMTDMPISEALEFTDIQERQDSFKAKEVDNELYVKGARLYMYPPQFNIYRMSSGIKKPKPYYDTYKNAQKKIGTLRPTYSKAIQLSDTEIDFNKLIQYSYYNLKRK